jgi:hypothetical protein
VPELFAMAFAVDDCTEVGTGAPFVEQYLSTFENARIPVTDDLALKSLLSGAWRHICYERIQNSAKGL